MKILYLTPGVFDKGGISRYGRYQIEALRRLVGPDDVIVYSLHGHRQGDFETAFAIDWAAGGISRGRKVAFARRAFAFALRRRPDVVWCAHVHLLPLAMAVAASAGATCVLNVYGLEVWSGRRPLVDWAMRHVPHVVSDCHNTAEYLRREKRWAGKSLLVAWDCVDLERFGPGPPQPDVARRLGLPADERIRVLMFGRMARIAVHKGWGRILDVVDRLDDPRFVFILAGDGDLRPHLMEETRRRGLSDRVCFSGSIHEDDLVDLYRSADIFTLVSDAGQGRGEGIPLTPLEAAACGVPILVGNRDGSREAVVDGENGFIIDPFDLDAHVARIRSLADPALRRRMGDAAHRRIREFHSFPTFVETHRQVLDIL